jgi:hypothetical protein
MAKQDQAAMEAELKRLEMEEELSRLESEEAQEQAALAPIPASEQIETGVRSALESATLGVSEPAISGVNAVIGNLIESGFEAEGLKDFLSKSVDTARIQKEYERDVQRRRQLEQAAPGVALTGAIAGALSPAGPAAALGRAAKAVVGGAKLAVPGAQALARLPGAAPIGSIVEKALEAGLTGAGQIGAQQAVEQATGFMEPEEAVPVSDIAKASAGIGGALATIPVVGRAVKAGGAKALSAFGGVSEKTIKKYMAREAPLLPITEEALKDTVDAAVSRVQDGIRETRKQAADDLMVAVRKLKENIIQGSKESFDILEKEGVSKAGGKKVIRAQSIRDEIEKQISAQRPKGGDVLLNELRESVVNKLNDLKDRFNAFSAEIGEEIDLVSAKELIKSLDEVTEFAKSEGQFSSRLDQSLSSIRSSINKQLRSLSPAYAKKMDQISEQAGLLNEVSDLFGTEKAALSNLQTLAVGKNPRVTALANRLEDLSGIKISRGLQAIKSTAPVERLDPKTTQAFLKTAMSGRSIEARRTLDLLSQLADEDLVKLADDAALSAEFSKVVQNGSRDVNFWKEVLGGGTALGGVTGGALAGPGGALVGASVGYMVKTFGAPATKVILDGLKTVQGIPTVAKLNSALSEVPPKAREQLVQGFIRANAVGMAKDEPQQVMIPAESRQTAIDEIQQSQLDSVSKAKAVQSLRATGKVDLKILKKHILGEQPQQPKAIIKPDAKEVLNEDRPDILKKMAEKR